MKHWMEALITESVDEIEEQQTQREADEVKSDEFKLAPIFYNRKISSHCINNNKKKDKHAIHITHAYTRAHITQRSANSCPLKMGSTSRNSTWLVCVCVDVQDVYVVGYLLQLSLYL